MNILHITPDENFARKFIVPLAKQQIKNNEIIVIAAPSTTKIKSPGDIKYENVDTKISKRPWVFISTFLHLKKIITKYKISHAIFHTSVDSSLLIILSRLFTNVNITYINHGVPFLGYSGFLRILLKSIDYFNINFSHHAFAINKSMAFALNNLKFINKKVTPFEPGSISGVSHRFTDFDELLDHRHTSHAAPTKILFVGRPVKRKGIQDILTAISMVKSNVQLFIAGGSEDDLSKFTYDKSKVKVLGFLDSLDSVYLECDILCVPSHHEGLGQVYLEAATFGVIPICSDIPGPTDFIKNGINGFSTPIANPQKIAECIDNLISDPLVFRKIQKTTFHSSISFNQLKVCELNARKIQETILSD